MWLERASNRGPAGAIAALLNLGTAFFLCQLQLLKWGITSKLAGTIDKGGGIRADAARVKVVVAIPGQLCHVEAGCGGGKAGGR